VNLKKIAVIEDNSDLFKGIIKNTKDAEFVYLDNTKVEDLKKLLKNQDIMASCIFLLNL